MANIEKNRKLMLEQIKKLRTENSKGEFGVSIKMVKFQTLVALIRKYLKPKDLKFKGTGGFDRGNSKLTATLNYKDKNNLKDTPIGWNDFEKEIDEFGMRFWGIQIINRGATTPGQLEITLNKNHWDGDDEWPPYQNPFKSRYGGLMKGKL